MGRPRITIVTPSFNQSQFIEETIASIHEQGYPNLEHIIVDGGSTDESVEVIRRHEKRLAWWVSEKDRGQGHAINKGFERATGHIHAFLNSDDLLEPGSLDAAASMFERGAAWIASPVRCFGDGRADWIYPALANASAADWLSGCPIPQQGCFWSAAEHRRLGPFREDLRYVFDYEFWLRLLFKGRLRLEVIDRPLGAFRHHGDSKTVSSGARFEPEERRVRAEYRRLLGAAERLAAWGAERHALACKRQVRALERAALSDRGGALRDVAASVGLWPPMFVRRRTAGALLRAIRGGGAQA